MKILLVDDSGTMRAIQKRCLYKMGISEDSIVEAENGKTGLDKFIAEQFDLVLTDWNMPVMDGLTLLREIRNLNKQIPVIMITTEAERARVLTAIENGVSDYLVKPFTPESLGAKLDRWVSAPA